LNGAASVLASVLAVATGMYAGFTISILLGAACYGVSLATVGKLRGGARPAAVEAVAPRIEGAPSGAP
jgi:hypothetical protein